MARVSNVPRKNIQGTLTMDGGRKKETGSHKGNMGKDRGKGDENIQPDMGNHRQAAVLWKPEARRGLTG